MHAFAMACDNGPDCVGQSVDVQRDFLILRVHVAASEDGFVNSFAIEFFHFRGTLTNIA